LRELPGKAWLAARGFLDDLLDELKIDPGKLAPDAANAARSGKSFAREELVYLSEAKPNGFWNRNVLEKPFVAEFNTISEAASILKGMQRNWAHYPIACFRRAELIKERLPYVNEKPRPFPFEVPTAPLGMWSLLDEHTLFGSARTTSPFPAGELQFVEDHENPPSRAYLKMFEALAWVGYLDRVGWTSAATIPNGRYSEPESSSTTIPNGRYTGGLPGPGTRCVDAGACPGGWTWALRQLGASVTAIDRSELAPALMADSAVRFIKHDAFTLRPADLGPQDWVCSDVICYPPRLLEWVREWIDSGLCRNFICTIKMQGAPDHETTRAFAAIPNSRIVHLTANKHELTWLCRLPDSQ